MQQSVVTDEPYLSDVAQSANGRAPWRAVALTAAVAIAFGAISGQLVRLALRGQVKGSAAISEAQGSTYARPDIVDRHGRLIATDIETYSLFADPGLVVDRDEAVEKLASVLPGLDEAELRATLADPARRFAWVRRGLTPKAAQAIHNLGLPGFAFRRELKRAYPTGTLAGHILGSVNVDNKGMAGLERWIDDKIGVEMVHGATQSEHAPVRLALDLGVQHALEDELRQASDRYKAAGAAGIVLDVASGEVVAAASMPDVDPARPAVAPDPERRDRLMGGTYELGSIFKTVTLAMGLDNGQIQPSSIIDVREPLTAGRYTIKDLHPIGRPISVTEVFLHSSNVGAGKIALEAGTARQREFLARLGLLTSIESEPGLTPPPQVPEHWDRAETITISYGHGLAVSPLQFVVAAAALVNGGEIVSPTFLRRGDAAETPRKRVISAQTSAQVRELLRRNVTDKEGTGRRAEVPGFEVGGKTGTADVPGPKGYRKGAVIASFLGAFPMHDPRFVTLVLLFEPKPSAETKNQVLAGLNAAPTTGRIIARIAPLLGVLPEGAQVVASEEAEMFDAP